MKTILTIAMMALLISAKAQVTLEHSYSSNWQMEVVNIEGDGYKYLGVDTATKDIKIYNTDHSLWKTIHTSIPQASLIYSVNSFASKYLFNADNKIEVMVLYAIIPSYTYKAELYNEDGTILNTFNNTSSYNIANVDGDWKLLIRNGTSPQYTDVYSLPGQWTGISVTGKASPSSNIFPNPLEDAATIRYELPAGCTQATLAIYNMAGQQLRSYNITNQFSDIVIDKGTLPTGNYIYDITTPNGRQPGQKFMIR